jgi:sugar phosphate isomerase/epimerase
MVEGYSELIGTLEEHDARLVIEGWPGPGCVCSTPETFRAFLKSCPSDRIGIVFDPSHLLRMGIDPLRFLREFAHRVFHVHGKDTELLGDALFEFGHEVPAVFAPRVNYGAFAWRYTIPGHGLMRWIEAFRILEEHGYGGCVSIELEDANFNHGTDGQSEKQGLILAGNYLSGC